MKILWTEETGRLQSMGLQSQTRLSTHTRTYTDSQEMWLFIPAVYNLMSSKKKKKSTPIIRLPSPENPSLWGQPQGRWAPSSVRCSHTDVLSIKCWHFSKLQNHPLFGKCIIFYIKKCCYFQSYEISWITVSFWSEVPVKIKLLRKKKKTKLFNLG